MYGRPVIVVELIGGWRIATKFPIEAWPVDEAKGLCNALGGTFIPSSGDGGGDGEGQGGGVDGGGQGPGVGGPGLGESPPATA